MLRAVVHNSVAHPFIARRFMPPRSFLQNITLKRLGQDGDSAESIARSIIKVAEQVATLRSGMQPFSS
jgi:hypothetical protein